MLARLLQRLAHPVRDRWDWYTRLRINNLRINHIPPLPVEAVAGVARVRIASHDVTEARYRAFLELDALSQYRAFDYPHSKVLEYLVTYDLTRPGPQSRVLDAAGGPGAEYVRALLELSDFQAVYCQDASLAGRQEGRVRYVGGSVDRLELEDGSVSAVSCHHSLEHFRGDVDSAFVREVCRILEPGGIACIVPLFLTRDEFEIWNVWPRARYSVDAKTIFDPFATFAGWGPYEHFARTYTPGSFRQRIVDQVSPEMEIEVVRITYEANPCPDITKNRHQPRLNGDMKALVLRSTPGRRGA